MRSFEIIRNKDELVMQLKFNYTGIVNAFSPMNEDLVTQVSVKNNRIIIEDENRFKRLIYSFNYLNEEYIGSERKISVEGLYNCRDIGGYEAFEHKIIKWGKMYRSDALNNLSSNDIRYLTSMNIGSVIDFRSEKEAKLLPDYKISNEQNYIFDANADVAAKASRLPVIDASNKDRNKVLALVEKAKTIHGRNELVQMQDQMLWQMEELVLSQKSQDAYRQFLLLLSESDSSVLFHCQGGKDRTGWATALILTILGVNKEDIIRDYMLTEQNNKPRNEKRMSIYRKYTDNIFVLDYLASLQKTKLEYLSSAFDALEKNFVDIEDYVVRGLNLKRDILDYLRDKYLY